MHSHFEEMKQFVRQQLAQHQGSDSDRRFPFRDRYTHTLRVLRWALRIQMKEGGDREVVTIAAIFHDVCKGLPGRPHGELGAELCDRYLCGKGYPAPLRAKVFEAIWYHSHKEDAAGLSIGLETEILIDADSLDEVGALTVLWDSMAAGLEPESSYERVYERLNRAFSGIRQQSMQLITPEGRRLYTERVLILERFLEELRLELGC